MTFLCASFNEADAMNTNREAVPHISMSRDARYVTQSNVWGSHILGPLTDRAIARYRGWTRPKPARRPKSTSLSQLLKELSA